MQISVSYTELDGCSKLLASLLNHVEALRADLLVVTGDVAASLKEHELCKVGLYEYNAKAQEAYSSSLKELMLQVYDISQALLLQGITKPTFDTVEVRLLLTHDVSPPKVSYTKSFVVARSMSTGICTYICMYVTRLTMH